jgi:HJR/Mrr/RecB family endonuclease
MNKIVASSELADSYFRAIQTSSSISSFINSWNGLKRECDRLVSYRSKTLDRNVRFSIDELKRSVQNIDSDYQWMACNVIERMKKQAVKEMKTTYKFSSENREKILRHFEDEIELGYGTFSNETKAIANSMLQEVASVAGIQAFFPRSSDIQTRSIPDETSIQRSSLDEVDIDNMDGQSFEYLCADLLRANGFANVEVTKGSGDQGVDILAVKDEIRYAFQCKCYTSDIGNKPVQEVFAGKSIYNCHIGVVLTNSFFTDGAKEAAKATGVLLWDRRKLRKLIEKANG